MERTMAPIRADIRDMKGDIRDIKRLQGQVWKLATRVSNFSTLIPPIMTHSKNHNLSAGAGDDAMLEVVPFTNGRDPTKDPVSFCFSSTSAMSLCAFLLEQSSTTEMRNGCKTAQSSTARQIL
jgi:hypothetical protein